MKSCVLAYSGGLDTSVILGWLQDQGYEVHAVYVDLGQPGEDRQATLEKAQNCGAKSSRIVDVREELRERLAQVLRVELTRLLHAPGGAEPLPELRVQLLAAGETRLLEIGGGLESRVALERGAELVQHPAAEPEAAGMRAGVFDGHEPWG